MASRAKEVGQVISQMSPADRHWIEDLLPFGVVSSLKADATVKDAEIAVLMQEWGYQDKLDKKREVGKGILRKFRNFEHLFTLPSISREIIDLAGDPMVAASKMAKIIEKDPVLTSRMLKVVNSAFYGFRRQIVSVEHAVVIWATMRVINLAFSIAVHQVMERIAPKRQGSCGNIPSWWHTFRPGWALCWDALSAMPFTRWDCSMISQDHLSPAGILPGGSSNLSSLEDLAGEEKETGLSHARWAHMWRSGGTSRKISWTVSYATIFPVRPLTAASL
jgi:hypothetical protein